MNRRTIFKILAALPFIGRIPAVRTYIDTNLAPPTETGLQPGWEEMIYSIQMENVDRNSASYKSWLAWLDEDED